MANFEAFLIRKERIVVENQIFTTFALVKFINQ
jgi:hypothetical protein